MSRKRVDSSLKYCISQVMAENEVKFWRGSSSRAPRKMNTWFYFLPISVLNGSGRPSLAPGRPRPDPEGQVKYGSGQRGPAVGQAGGRERWRFFRPPLTWADLGPALDPEIRKRVVNLQKITLKSFISWGRVKFCVEL